MLSPLKPIKGSLKSKVLMVLYTVFNGEYKGIFLPPLKPIKGSSYTPLIAINISLIFASVNRKS